MDFVSRSYKNKRLNPFLSPLFGKSSMNSYHFFFLGVIKMNIDTSAQKFVASSLPYRHLVMSYALSGRPKVTLLRTFGQKKRKQ